jgi:hypothetical protein
MLDSMKTSLLLILALMAQGCASSRHLAFDVHPCFGEVHLSLADVVVVDANGNAVAGATLAGPPRALIRDGSSETELGEFEPGCSGGLRVHIPLPDTQSEQPVIILRGKLSDGTEVTGRQQIDAIDYR